MITLAWYFLKVIVAAGILYGYYLVALRDKVFHDWNRFFLLASVVISLTVPLMKINVLQSSTEEKSPMVTMLQNINGGDEAVQFYNSNSTSKITTQNVIELIYILITCTFLIIFFSILYKLKRLRKYPVTKLNNISFFSTNAAGTPFSFFNSIFWNIAIDLHSQTGQQIFKHEMAHIKEKHSYDKIFMNIVLIFFWINPFFWFMRKELNMIHEFIADRKSVEDSDLSSFAAMILKTVHPSQNFALTNSFFYSPLKRRILMLTKNKNPKVNYLSRLMVLPIAAIMFAGFTLHIKSSKLPANNSLYAGKTITVVIDAGHGGNDFGTISPDGAKEKDINLYIAKRIAELNNDEHIKILLSRPDDKYITPGERTAFSENNHADLFISIHVNAADKDHINEKGFSVLIGKNNSEKNKLLASALINELQKTYTTQTAIGVRSKSVWVLDHNVCPATLIECGYFTNAADEAFISNTANQEKVARSILDAINDYSKNESSAFSPVITPNAAASVSTFDTLQPLIYKSKKVKKVSVTSISPKVNITYEDGTRETITEAEAKRSGLLPAPPPPPPAPGAEPPVPPVPPVNAANPNLPPPPPPLPANAFYLIDGKESTVDKVKNISPDNIVSISVLKDTAATNKYGDKAKNGAIEIYTKNISVKKNPLTIVNGKKIPYDVLNTIDPNTIESITVLKDKNTVEKYGKEGENGVILITLKHDTGEKQPMPNKVFTQVEQPATYPGGNAAWNKYITQVIQKNIKTLESDKKNTGTCVVKFIVNTDGSISNVEAITMKETQLGKVATDALKLSPRWVPGKQNDHLVASYVMQPVSFKISDDLQKNEPK